MVKPGANITETARNFSSNSPNLIGVWNDGDAWCVETYVFNEHGADIGEWLFRDTKEEMIEAALNECDFTKAQLLQAVLLENTWVELK